MKIKVGQISALDGPMVRFAVILTVDDGEELMIYPGWTLNVYREVQPPATKTARGFYKRFTEISIVLERMLLEALEQGFPEIEEILGPKQDRRLQKKLIAGEVKIREPRPSKRRKQAQSKGTAPVKSKGQHGMGHVYLRGKKWWIKYHKDGKPFYESSGSPFKQAAIELLKTRWAETLPRM